MAGLSGGYVWFEVLVRLGNIHHVDMKGLRYKMDIWKGRIECFLLRKEENAMLKMARGALMSCRRMCTMCNRKKGGRYFVISQCLLNIGRDENEVLRSERN